MKIIFLEAVQDHGGARKSTIELAKRIKSLGHEVLIVDFWGCDQPFVDAVNEAQLNLKILVARKQPFIVKSNSIPKYLWNAIQYFFLEKRYKKIFSKIVNEFKPDIVNVNNIKCLNILNMNSSYSVDFFARGWFDYRSVSFFSRKKLKKNKLRFLTVSQSTRQAIYTGGIAEMGDIKVLTSVIEEQTFNSFQPDYKPFTAENPIKILFSGGFLKSKGQNTCIEIASKLKKMEVPFKMYLTGIIYKGEESNQYYQDVLKLVTKFKLEKQVNVVLDPPDIMSYFKMCDILIHPSWTEGLPRVALEALAFGKPVIANSVGGVTDVVIHNFTGFITDFNDINQYVEYITRYVKNDELYRIHSTSARQLIKQNYLDSHQIEGIKRIYPM